MNILPAAMQYMRERQTPLIKFLHIAIIFLVISQIIVSDFIAFDDVGRISSDSLAFYGTWLHILTGLFIIPVAVSFFVVALRLHGFKYYFPYLSGEFTQLRKDINLLLKLKLPEASNYGIAATIQGLGLSALFFVLCSGLLWFISWKANFPWSHDVKEVHEIFTGLFQVYIIGHGGMGILHIFLNSKLLKAR